MSMAGHVDARPKTTVRTYVCAPADVGMTARASEADLNLRKWCKKGLRFKS